MPQKLTIIAEAGVNHNGSIDRALAMVDVAADAGADIIKFQTFSADRLAGKDAQLAEYQRTSASDTRSQWDLLKALELTQDEFTRIRERCSERGIQFLSTGFGIEELRFLVDEMRIPVIKIGSGDLSFAPMLVEAGTTGLPVILSTGMADLDEIAIALEFIGFGYARFLGVPGSESVPTESVRRAIVADVRVTEHVRSHVTVLHCTTQYPAAPELLNLRAMSTIAERFGLPVGYSDHSEGSLASIVAVSLGATVIEKHFTMDKNLDGPDHHASLDVPELLEFVLALRSVEVVLGSSEKVCLPEERSNRAAVRRSIVAIDEIPRGSIIHGGALECRRPDSGRTAFDFFEVLGTTAARDYPVGSYVD